MKTAVFYENIYDGAKKYDLLIEDVLYELKHAGMELVYISAASLKRDGCWLLPLIARLGIGIEGVHAFCDFAKDPDAPEFDEILARALDCGAGNLLIVPGMLSGSNTLSSVENIVSGLRRAVLKGRSKNLPVLMEDFDSMLSPYNSIFSLDWFLKNVEGLGCAFDTGNFVMYHEDELEAFERFKDKIVTVHLKDRVNEKKHPNDHACLCADGKQVFSCEIGSGFIRIAEILKRLKNASYKGNVIAELYGCDPEFVLDDIFASLAFIGAQKAD